tara:strand:+ start:84 stop:416 length:333 start_codon:yes stop_codon:yes gene_type:complete
MAIKANIVIDQGTDFSALIDVETASGVVFNLQGYTVAAQMRKTYTSSTASNFTCSHNGVLGQISISLDSSVTEVLDPGRYLYDIEITSGGGGKSRVVQGTATVTAGITRT